MATRESFGQLLRRYRRDAELTQEGLAERAGISVRAVRDIEAGGKHQPRQDTVQLLLEALDIPLEERTTVLAAVGRVPEQDGPAARGDATRQLPPVPSKSSSARAAFPTGTVTFLFTDIEGSTHLLQELGAERYRDALEDHRRLLRGVVAQHGGHEVDTQGDAFFVAFSRARDAVRAAEEAQRVLAAHPWPEGCELRVRMGIHTCEATPTSEGYVGVGVHRGARIGAAGHGGQVLLSHTTYDLIEDEEIGFEVRDLGEHRLKDLEEPHRLFQLVDPAVPQHFPPLRTLENRPTNLPIQPTALVGREREIGEIARLLQTDGVRLVTLTGPGGTGKTRLALQAAAELLEEFPHGVYFVTLAGQSDPQLVLPTVAQTLGINEAAGQSLARYLSSKKVLLVIDNFEHLLDAAPRLAELLTTTQDLRLLVTSREPLHLAGEHVCPVPPLNLPDPHHLPDLSALLQYEAVALFVERAQAVDPGFEVTSANAPAVAEICLRLDGLPLALELAAGRVPLLSPEAMLTRLGERLKLLRGGRRDAPARQQTLRDTLVWSYDLLNDEERVLFARLGVFTGGFTLEAAEAVCDAELDTLGSLVEKNLIRRDGERLAMLETIREYSLEKLAESGETDESRRRHLEYFISLAESANLSDLNDDEQRMHLVLPERNNIRAALEWALGADEIDLGLTLVVTLEGYWVAASPLEGTRWLGTLLPRARQAPDEQHARALGAWGHAAAMAGEYEEAERLHEVSLAAFRRLGDDRGAATVLQRLAMDAMARGDMERAQVCVDESLRLYRSKRAEALALRTYGFIEWQAGNHERAVELFEQSAALAGEAGQTWLQASFLLHRAELLLEQGRLGESESASREALRLATRIGARQATIIAVSLLAQVEGEAGQPERAGRLWGAIEAEEARGPVGQWDVEREEAARPVLAHAGPEFERGRQEGRHLSLQEAADEVLQAERIVT